MSQVHDRIDCLEERAHAMEENMQNYSKAHNKLLDAHEHRTEKIHHIKIKLADLEDRCRQNNIKFRGIPESIKPNEITDYLQQLISKLLPRFNACDTLIDQTHRIANPSDLPEDSPRDVLARIHFFSY